VGMNEWLEAAEYMQAFANNQAVLVREKKKKRGVEDGRCVKAGRIRNGLQLGVALMLLPQNCEKLRKNRVMVRIDEIWESCGG